MPNFNKLSSHIQAAVKSGIKESKGSGQLTLFTKHDFRVEARGPGFLLQMTLHGQWREELATSAIVLKHPGS